MANRQHPPHPSTSPKIARPPLRTKTIFDGTNPRLEPRRSKTTTYGRKCPFQLNSISQKCTTFSPTSPRLSPFSLSRLSPRERSSRPSATGEGSPFHHSLTFVRCLKRLLHYG